MRYNSSMNGREFTRRAQRYARRAGRRFYLDTRRGKGSHVTVYIGERHTQVKYGEIHKGALMSMLKDLDIYRERF